MWRSFIDPFVAVGYDFEVTAGSNFASVILLALVFGDNIYDLYLWGNTLLAFVDTGIGLLAGVEHFFDAGDVDRFCIGGIEIDALLDPADVNAFVTGLTHVSAWTVGVTQTPISIFVPAGVPEPMSLLLFGVGVAAPRGLIVCDVLRSGW